MSGRIHFGMYTCGLFIALLIGVDSVEAAPLYRNLKLGDRGQDVISLQKILNTDPFTQITLSGAGSPGNETDYFGTLTHQAVVRFQEKYREQILTPLGLARGTGYIGAGTRSFLNGPAFTGASVTSSQVSTLSYPSTKILVDPSVTAPVSPIASEQPIIYSVLPNIVDEIDEKLTISGSGFSKIGNTVLVSTELPESFTNLPSLNGKIIEVTFNFFMRNVLKGQADAMPTNADFDRQDIYAMLAQAVKGSVYNAERKAYLYPVNVFVKNAEGVISEPVVMHLDIAALLAN